MQEHSTGLDNIQEIGVSILSIENDKEISGEGTKLTIVL
jgi:hypothetical protein